MIGTSLLLALSLFSRGGTDTTLKLSVGTLILLHANTEPVQIRISEGDLVTVQGGTVWAGNIETQPVTNGAVGKPVLGIIAGPVRAPGQPVVPLVVGVPAWATLYINSNTGDITLTGSLTELSVQTTTGAIRIDDGGGKATLTSVAGNVTVSRFQGSQLTIYTPGGDIGIYTAFGAVKASSTTGSITLRSILSMQVSASTVSGQVQIDGPFASSGVYTLESHSGAVTIFAPADFSARVDATTYTGHFLSEYTQAAALASRTTGATGGSVGGRGGGRVGGAATNTGAVGTVIAAAPPTADKVTSVVGAAPSPLLHPVTFGSGETHFILNSFSGDITIRRSSNQE